MEPPTPCAALGRCQRERSSERGRRTGERPALRQQEHLAGGPARRDLGLFVYEAHAELLEWYTKSIRELGYTGLVTHYDWLNHLGIQALRNRVPVISMHGYHAHPSEYTSPGSKVSQESSVAAGEPALLLDRHHALQRSPAADHGVRPGLLEPLPLRGRSADGVLRGPAGHGWPDGPRHSGAAIASTGRSIPSGWRTTRSPGPRRWCRASRTCAAT